MDDKKFIYKVLLSFLIAPLLVITINFLLYFPSLVVFCRLNALGNPPPKWIISCGDFTEPGILLALIMIFLSISLTIYGIYDLFWKKHE
jgi:hypothetical protein